MKTITLPDGNTFTGEFKDNVRNGAGMKTYINGATYEGYWLNDLRHGEGVKTQSDGTQTLVEYRFGEKVSHKEKGMICLDNVELTKTTLGEFCANNSIEEPGGIMSTKGYSVATTGTFDGVGGVLRFPVHRTPYFIPANHYDSYVEMPEALAEEVSSKRHHKFDMVKYKFKDGDWVVWLMGHKDARMVDSCDTEKPYPFNQDNDVHANNYRLATPKEIGVAKAGLKLIDEQYDEKVRLRGD